MKIAVIGAGYVGLVSAAGLASLGHTVKVGERDADRVEMLNRGKMPLHEDGLGEVTRSALTQRRLSFHTDNHSAILDAHIIMIALPTPPAADGSADLSIIHAALLDMAPSIGQDSIVVTKSTVPVGSAETFEAILRGAGANAPVVSNPEFLREGSALADFYSPDRIVIGANDSEVASVVAQMYEGIDAQIVLTDPRSSEMIKYASNAYLATRLTFANTLANVCEFVDADVTAVLSGVGADHRIGSHFLKPGPGYGGSCFPKDTMALVSIAADAGYDFALMRGVIEANEAQMSRTVGKVLAFTDGIEQPRVGMWGIAFKAGTDDTRHSPAVSIAEALIDEDHTLVAYDPAVTQAPLRGIQVAASAVDAARDADVLVIATEWPEFADEDLQVIADAMRGSAIIDARNLLDQSYATSLGFSYVGIGR